MDHPFLPVDLRHLALSSLVLASHNPYHVVLTDRYRPCLVGKSTMSTSISDFGEGRKPTLYLFRSSFESAEDIIFRRTDEGAEKWAFRALRREEETSVDQ